MQIFTFTKCVGIVPMMPSVSSHLWRLQCFLWGNCDRPGTFFTVWSCFWKRDINVLTVMIQNIGVASVQSGSEDRWDAAERRVGWEQDFKVVANCTVKSALIGREAWVMMYSVTAPQHLVLCLSRRCPNSTYSHQTLCFCCSDTLNSGISQLLGKLVIK